MSLPSILSTVVGRFPLTQVYSILKQCRKKNSETCVIETADRRHFLKINNIFLHLTGVDYSSVKLLILRKMMLETFSNKLGLPNHLEGMQRT